MRKNLLLSGLRRIDQGEAEKLTRKLRSTLSSLNPSLVITDYSPGWNQLGLDAALAEGIPVVGAAPFPTPLIPEYKRRVRSSSVFAGSFEEFFASPEGYIEYLGANVDMVVAYYPSNAPSSYFHNLVLSLGLPLHDMTA